MRLALPKGRLLEGTFVRLARGGLTFRFASDRDYRPTCSDPTVQAKLVKVRAIPQLVALGNFDVGFCGLDLVREAGYDDAVPILDLSLNRVEIVVAVRRGQDNLLAQPPKRPLLIATEYERLADEWALRHNLAHITIQTWGSTEAFAPEDADIVFDCMETGRTLEANGLVIVDRILSSATWLVANRRALKTQRAAIDDLKDRLA
jgi:ATP phosphoribosyltransferase